MTKPANWMILVFILSICLARIGQAQCILSVAEPQICVLTSLLATIRCHNETGNLMEWLDTNDQKAVWVLIRPNGQQETASNSRYSQASNLISMSPGKEAELSAPLTRWFSLRDTGTYRLRFKLRDASRSIWSESNEVSFHAILCKKESVLASCQGYLNRKPPDLEAVSGLDSEAAIPCIEEALSRKSDQSVSLIEGLARINTPEAIMAIVKHFDKADAFDRLAVWQALHRIDASSLSTSLRDRIREILKEAPIIFKD